MKIFCIGLPRTGTTTFHHMMKTLGYKSISNVHNIKSAKEAFEYAKNSRFNAFSDNPWPTYWKELAEEFKNTKFINLTRDAKKWRYSFLKMVSHTTKSPIDIKNQAAWRIGAVKEFINDPNGELFIQRNEEVSSYFKNRQNFIELDWTKHGYIELTKFLEIPIVNKNTLNVSMFKSINTKGLKAISENLSDDDQKKLWDLIGELK